VLETQSGLGSHTHMSFDGLLRKPHSTDGSEYEPADFYAGLRHRPFMSKSWFSFAECWDDARSKRWTKTRDHSGELCGTEQ
jgi:hypothetical protein